MVSTRSQDKAQTGQKRASPSSVHDDKPAPAKKQKKLTPKARIARDSPGPNAKSAKQAKPQKSSSLKSKNNDTSTTTTKQENEEDESKPIIINRAPVLHLWSACVTQKLHPKLSWETSLSAGAAVSALCAISKGRAIGVVEPKDPDKPAATKKDDDGFEELEVMHFKLRVKGGKVYVGEKVQSHGEDGLKKKFGERYEDVKKCFEEALGVAGSDLDGRAFKMYEEFRPDVSKGQKGWGRKGELDLDNVRSIVSEK